MIFSKKFLWFENFLSEIDTYKFQINNIYRFFFFFRSLLDIEMLIKLYH